MVGERLCLSKALSNFDISGRMLTSTKFLRVPVGQTFDRLRLALPFFGCAERYGSTESVPLLLWFCIGTIRELSGNSTPAVPVVPCRKGVCYKQKISGGKSILKTAVIYARYSCDAQTEQSIEGQLHVCKEYAEKNDLLVVDEYIDRATTGTNDNRAAFQQMLADSKRRQWSVVIVYKLDRFARNMYESVINRKKLSDNGVGLVSAMENIPDTPEGKLFQAVIEGFNEYYSAELSQKVRRGFHENRKKGLFCGGSIIFGYRVVNKRVEINEDEANIVRYIFDQYAHGRQAKDILNELTARGIGRRNKPFPINTFYSILHNPKYIGVANLSDGAYTNIYPPIIPKELFEKVQMILEKNKRGSRSKDTDYLLTRKCICGYCGRNIHAETGTARDGTVRHYYKCDGRKNHHDCQKSVVRKDDLEQLVLQITRDIIGTSENRSLTASWKYTRNDYTTTPFSTFCWQKEINCRKWSTIS